MIDVDAETSHTVFLSNRLDNTSGVLSSDTDKYFKPELAPDAIIRTNLRAFSLIVNK